ncbi:MAG: TIGR02147 family protein [Deltaproteobacteria bacterium]|nr:TIGR02147 family protein [Deltaproteobacteria bacterium]
MAARSAIDIFEYLDYRAYLRDFYLEQKARGRGFSYRSFSRRAKLRSPNYLKLVIDGERNLTQRMATRFAAGCGLDGEEAEFFVDLVAFAQAKTATEKAARYRKLTGSRRYRSAHELEVAQADYHSKWFLPAIRELVAREDFEDDAEWIASRLRPCITTEEAADGLDLLLRIGLLIRADDGSVAQGEPLVSTGPEAFGVHIVTYHRAMLDQASASLDNFTGADRDISSLTLCVGSDGLRRLKERIRRFRRELLELSALEDDPEQVVQVNLQLFPLSSRRSEEP